MEKCYTIQDEKTGRFLSWRSMPDTNKEGNSYLYITYSGKVGTDFYKTIESAERDFNMLQKRNEACKMGKSLHIIKVDADNLPVGERFIEHVAA